MKQSTVRTLLSRLTEQLVLYFSEEGKITETTEFSERMALSTWEGLILLLRQSIANSDEVLLEEVGHLRKADGTWIFEPAASLLEVDAIKLPTREEHEYLAQKALFYLNQGAELLANIPDDQVLSSAPLAAEERLLLSVFGDANMDDRKLSDSVALIGDRLMRKARRLRQEKSEVTQLGERRIEHYGTPRDRARELYSQSAERVGEVAQTAREAAARQTGTVAAAIDAGKKAYQSEKRRAELSRLLEEDTSAADSAEGA